MAIQRTLSMIKPDAVSVSKIGQIYSRFEQAGLQIVAAKMQHLTPRQAEDFYAIHKAKPFFSQLIQFICSGPVMIQVLEGEEAVSHHRNLIGATDPQHAAQGTLRADFAASVDRNAVHGSDTIETAAEEIAFFFSETEIFSRQ